MRHDKWRKREEAHLRRFWGQKSVAQLSKDLGRSEAAVTVRAKRLGIRTITSMPECLTESDLARMLGICNKSAYKLLRNVPSLPVADVWQHNKTCRVVWKHDLLRWIRDWRNWIYVDAEKIADEQVRRVFRRERVRWGDEWIGTKEIADVLGVDRRKANDWLQQGVFKSAVKHGNWWCLRSEVEFVKDLREGQSK